MLLYFLVTGNNQPLTQKATCLLRPDEARPMTLCRPRQERCPPSQCSRPAIAVCKGLWLARSACSSLREQDAGECEGVQEVDNHKGG